MYILRETPWVIEYLDDEDYYHIVRGDFTYGKQRQEASNTSHGFTKKDQALRKTQQGTIRAFSRRTSKKCATRVRVR